MKILAALDFAEGAPCPAPVLGQCNFWGEFVLHAYPLGAPHTEKPLRLIGITIERREPLSPVAVENRRRAGRLRRIVVMKRARGQSPLHYVGFPDRQCRPLRRPGGPNIAAESGT